MALRPLVLLLVATAALALGDDTLITVGGETGTVAHFNEHFRALLSERGNSDELNTLIDRDDFILDTESILAWSKDTWYDDIVHPYKQLTRERLDEKLVATNNTLGVQLILNFADLGCVRGMKHIMDTYEVSPEILGQVIATINGRAEDSCDKSKFLLYLSSFHHILPTGGVYNPNDWTDTLCCTNNYEGMRDYIKKHPEQIYELEFYYSLSNCKHRTLAVIKGAVRRPVCWVF